MDVIVTRKYRGTPVYNYAVGTGAAIPIQPPNVPPINIPYPDPAVFNFQENNNPIIENYNTLYFPLYGRHPRFTLLIYEDSLPEQEEGFESENEIQFYTTPKLIVVDDVLIQVEYDLSGVGTEEKKVSGKIIINK